MSAGLYGTWLIVLLELKQRLRAVTWYVLIGISILLLTAVTTMVWTSSSVFDSGTWLYSIIIFLVLLLALLITPAISGNSINGESYSGSLASSQVTLVTTAQIVVGKWLAAWIASLSFLVVAVPFLIIAVVLGGLPTLTIWTSILVVIIELGVVSAIGVGLSGIISKPTFSIVATYLSIAALSVGTGLLFALGGLSTSTTTVYQTSTVGETTIDQETGETVVLTCIPDEYQVNISHYEYWWGVLAANPFMVLGDSVPNSFDEFGNPNDLFTSLSVALRSAQVPPQEFQAPECTVGDVVDTDQTFTQTYPTPEESIKGTVPTWFFGLAIHAVLAAVLLFWAWLRTRTPAKKLHKFSRIA